MTTTDFCDTFTQKEIEIFIQVDREPAGCEERLCGGNNWIFISHRWKTINWWQVVGEVEKLKADQQEAMVSL